MALEAENRFFRYDIHVWWEPAYVQTILDGAERPIAPLYFRILIGNISGHHATKE